MERSSLCTGTARNQTHTAVQAEQPKCRGCQVDQYVYTSRDREIMPKQIILIIL